MTRVPIHPMLVALLPVLSMYAVIPGVSGLDEIVRAAVVAIAIAGALLLIAAASYRDTRKAALLVSVFLLVLITFDKAYRPLSGWTFAGWHLLRPRFVLLASYLLLVAFAVWLMRTRRSFILTTVVANLAALGFLLPPVWLLLTAQVRAAESVRRVAALPPISAPATSHVRPDIFYLIFDRYGDEQTLRSYGFDNEPLYAYLSDHGFYVARASRSNYLRTILSLASSLNLTYLDDLTDKVGRDADTWQPLYDRVRDHRVAAFLHSQGYSYIHAGSWYTPTTLNPNAERNINCYTLAPYPMMRFLDSELIRPFTRRTDLLDRRRQQWWRVKRQIDEVLKLAPLRGPKLVFMHILVPHTPFVFDRDGAYVSADVEGRRTRQQNYINQVIAAMP
jgi:hypothetical protein